jgi:enamine deaminase RidA (YjgF/YER057c/UK114 family)
MRTVCSSTARLYTGGQIGWNKDQVFEHHDFVGQLEQTLANIAAIVRAAGGEVTDIVRLTWFITDKKEYLARQKDVGAAYRRVWAGISRRCRSSWLPG